MDEIALPLFYLLPKVQDYRYFKNVIDLGGINHCLLTDWSNNL